MKAFIRKLILIVLSCFTYSSLVNSAEPTGHNYDYVASEIFWQELYTYGGWTLYCGYRFENDKKTETGKIVSIEHIYPTKWIFEQLGCDSRMQCRESNNKRFAQMEADMHNMYPVWQALVTYRYDHSFGIVNGEEWRFDDCDFEWKAGITEPRPLARGNIARAIFYMHSKYGVLLDPEMLKVLKKWNRGDPPSDQEIARNDVIEKVQGDRNPYIDDYVLAEKITISARR